MAQARRKLTALPLASKSPRTTSRAAKKEEGDPLVGIVCRIPQENRMKLRQLALARNTTVQALLEQVVMDLLSREG